MAIIMRKGCIEAIYGIMGWKGLKIIIWYENLSDTSLYPNFNYGYLYSSKCTL